MGTCVGSIVGCKQTVCHVEELLRPSGPGNPVVSCLSAHVGRAAGHLLTTPGPAAAACVCTAGFAFVYMESESEGNRAIRHLDRCVAPMGLLVCRTPMPGSCCPQCTQLSQQHAEHAAVPMLLCCVVGRTGWPADSA